MKRYIKSSSSNVIYYSILIKVNDDIVPLCFPTDVDLEEADYTNEDLLEYIDRLVDEVNSNKPNSGALFPELFGVYTNAMDQPHLGAYPLNSDNPVDYSKFGKMFLDWDMENCYDESLIKQYYEEFGDDYETYEEYYNEVTSKNGTATLM